MWVLISSFWIKWMTLTDLCNILFLGIAEKRAKPIEFVYQTPDKVKGISTITMDINANDCKKIWDTWASIVFSINLSHKVGCILERQIKFSKIILSFFIMLYERNYSIYSMVYISMLYGSKKCAKYVYP